LIKNWTARGRVWFAIGVVAALLLITFALTAGRILVVDAPQPSDLILVLAGETVHRPAHALELLHSGYGKRMLIDVPAEGKIYEFSQLDLAQKYVRDLPDSAAVSICPIYGLSTREETHDVEKCLSVENGTSILIVTSDFHTRRALSIFRREIRGKSFSVGAAHNSTEFGSRWWTHRQWAKTCTDEWLRTIWWNLVERWK
jgi:DUF218 domain-containing protein